MDRYTLVFVASLSLIASSAQAHPGRTDSSGGHHNRKTGGYHYHGGGSSSSGVTGMSRTSARTGYRTSYRDTPRVETPKMSAAALKRQEATERERIATGQFEEAKNQADVGIAKLRLISTNFRGTQAARDAVAFLKSLCDDAAEDNADQQAAVSEQESDAQHRLNVAKRLMGSDREKGREWLELVIQQYPDTEAAEEAKSILGE